MRLTKANVAKVSLPAGKSDAIIFDDDLPGFGLRLRAGGKRTWLAQYRIGAKQRRVSLGTVENTDADEARRRAKTTLSKVHLGQDPQDEKNDTRARAAVTLRAIIDSYLVRHAEIRLKKNSLIEVRRYLCVLWSPLHETAVHSVTRATVAARLAEIAGANGPYAANRARAALSSFYGWAIGEGLTDINPVVGTNKATAETARDRVLGDDELALVWRHAGAGDYGAIIRLLILTGQRREEIGGMLWDELDLEAGLWSIGSARTKNRKAHDVPLSPAAVAILRAIPRREGREYVFGAGAGAFQGWSNSKSALDARIAQAGGKGSPWRLHDIRRTVATRLGDMKVLPHVVEAVLNHISGHKAGVAGIYNRAVYAAEKREALDRWAQRVLEIVGGV
jgi:integrase